MYIIFRGMIIFIFYYQEQEKFMIFFDQDDYWFFFIGLGYMIFGDISFKYNFVQIKVIVFFYFLGD